MIGTVKRSRVAVASPESVRDDLARLLHRGSGMRDFSQTDGVLDRSLRHRELHEPNGLGDELRGDDTPGFTRAETGLVASVGPSVAEGVRRATSFATCTDQHDGGEAPGLWVHEV